MPRTSHRRTFVYKNAVLEYAMKILLHLVELANFTNQPEENSVENLRSKSWAC